jgi:hypothetical protein
MFLFNFPDKLIFLLLDILESGPYRHHKRPSLFIKQPENSRDELIDCDGSGPVSPPILIRLVLCLLQGEITQKCKGLKFFVSGHHLYGENILIIPRWRDIERNGRR